MLGNVDNQKIFLESKDILKLFSSLFPSFLVYYFPSFYVLYLFPFCIFLIYINR